MSTFDDPKYGYIPKLKYSCWGNGEGLFNVIKVSNYDLNETNYT